MSLEDYDKFEKFKDQNDFLKFIYWLIFYLFLNEKYIQNFNKATKVK